MTKFKKDSAPLIRKIIASNIPMTSLLIRFDEVGYLRHSSSFTFYAYILSGQKLMKNAKSDQFGDFLNPETGVPYRPFMENANVKKNKCDILSHFQTLWCLNK